MDNEAINIIEQFRKRVSDILQPHHDEFYLRRWLKARKFVLADAEDMLRKHIQWREKVKVDTSLKEWIPPEALVKYYPGTLYGFDKDNCPLYIEPLGRIDPKGIMSCVKREDVIKFKIQDAERIYAKTLEKQKEFPEKSIGLVILADMEGLGMRHFYKPALDTYIEMVSMYEANYPEMLRRICIINAPRIFNVLYSIVKPFICEDTKSKILLLNSNWKEQLLEYIDADQLPKFWGGNAVGINMDPTCGIPMGGFVDPSYTKKILLDHNDYLKKTIKARHKFEVKHVIDIPETSIRWQFATENHDISFGISFKKFKQSLNELPLSDMNSKDLLHIEKENYVRPLMRFNSDLIPESDVFVCQKTGLYTLIFDNSYSWTKSKKLIYQIEVFLPNSNKSNALDTDFSDSDNISDNLFVDALE